ncbi:putative F-box protein [Salvia divinorum]|uniref:F-box protein n=1 Tax=Salvia divinorum TaxID=28513 RepID=A0ABD1IHP5_SALDI
METMNNDVLTEIFLRLPVKSRLRLKVVCKFWCHLINSSQPFKVGLQFSPYPYNSKIQVKFKNKSFSAQGPVKGIICICTNHMEPEALCYLFQGQLKPLPPSTYPDSCGISSPDVAVGFDGDDDFKVVQLMPCWEHNRLHARLYSRKTDSWRELAGDGVVDDLHYNSVIPIKPLGGNDGHFAHWRVNSRKVGGGTVSRIVSFDMKNEVFRTMRLRSDNVSVYRFSTIFAVDDNSFQRFYIPPFSRYVDICKSRCEGKELSWNHVIRSVELREVCMIPHCVFWEFYKDIGYVFLEHDGRVFIYDHLAREFVSKLPEAGQMSVAEGSVTSLNGESLVGSFHLIF